jgi:hypothetical protein
MHNGTERLAIGGQLPAPFDSRAHRWHGLLRQQQSENSIIAHQDESTVCKLSLKIHTDRYTALSVAAFARSQREARAPARNVHTSTKNETMLFRWPRAEMACCYPAILCRCRITATSTSDEAHGQSPKPRVRTRDLQMQGHEREYGISWVSAATRGLFGMCILTSNSCSWPGTCKYLVVNLGPFRTHGHPRGWVGDERPRLRTGSKPCKSLK